MNPKALARNIRREAHDPTTTAREFASALGIAVHTLPRGLRECGALVSGGGQAIFVADDSLHAWWALARAALVRRGLTPTRELTMELARALMPRRRRAAQVEALSC